jgi:hypothetical protein
MRAYLEHLALGGGVVVRRVFGEFHAGLSVDFNHSRAQLGIHDQIHTHQLITIRTVLDARVARSLLLLVCVALATSKQASKRMDG